MQKRNCPKCKGSAVRHSVETNLGSVAVYVCASCGYSFLEEKKARRRQKIKQTKK